MQNIHSLAIIGILFIAVFGCSTFSPSSESPPSTLNNSNRTLSDDAVDVAVGDAKIGVPECDQVMDELTAEMNSPDDNFVTKAIKATILNRIKDGIRESVEKNQQDKVEMAKTCKEFKAQLDKYKAEQGTQK